MARTRRRQHLLIALLAACLTAGLVIAQPVGEIIHRKNSLYHRIFVYRSGSVVTLEFLTRGPLVMQSRVDLNDPRRHVQEYTTLTFCGLLYQPRPRRILVLGLGGGVIPREMRHYFPDAEIDVAEIDPEMPRVAKQFFGFETDDKLRVHVADGRVFIRRLLRQDPVPRYDIIILDAFNGDYIPFHLMTREFLQEVRGVLADDGVVVANVFYNSRLCDAELRTFLDVFGRCQAYRGTHSTNVMLVSPGPEGGTLTYQEAAARGSELQHAHEFSFDIQGVALKLQVEARPDPRAPVLTDDQAPVNWLREQESEGSLTEEPEGNGEQEVKQEQE